MQTSLQVDSQSGIPAVMQGVKQCWEQQFCLALAESTYGLPRGSQVDPAVRPISYAAWSWIVIAPDICPLPIKIRMNMLVMASPAVTSNAGERTMGFSPSKSYIIFLLVSKRSRLGSNCFRRPFLLQFERLDRKQCRQSLMSIHASRRALGI